MSFLAYIKCKPKMTKLSKQFHNPIYIS